jgi:hypothetical protein
MYIRDILQELRGYYQGTYGMYCGKVYKVMDINPPDSDGYDDDGEEYWEVDNDGLLDVLDATHLFTADCIDIVSDTSDRVDLSDVEFVFPDVGLVNIPIEYSDTCKFNVVANVTRSVQRQYRRALRHNSLMSVAPFPKVRDMIAELTGQPHHELGGGVTNTLISNLFLPTYYHLDEALSLLEDTIGQYAITNEWWVGQGNHGIIFGYHDNICGDVTDGVFKLHDTLDFLEESLLTTIGEHRYAR